MIYINSENEVNSKFVNIVNTHNIGGYKVDVRLHVVLTLYKR